MKKRVVPRSKAPRLGPDLVLDILGDIDRTPTTFPPDHRRRMPETIQQSSNARLKPAIHHRDETAVARAELIEALRRMRDRARPELASVISKVIMREKKRKH